MGDQEGDMQPSSKDSRAEVTVLREELQLVLKKEMEAQVSVHTLVPATSTLGFFSHAHSLCALQKELAVLRSSLASHVDNTDGSAIQVGFFLYFVASICLNSLTCFRPLSSSVCWSSLCRSTTS